MKSEGWRVAVFFGNNEVGIENGNKDFVGMKRI